MTLGSWLRLGVMVVAGLTACTELKPIRVDAPAEHPVILPRPTLSAAQASQGRTGTRPRAGKENRQIIEEYPNYFIGYAEFDDQGWSYANTRQIDIIKDRIAADLVDPSNAGKDFLVLVFVHGWHHNAHDNDGNVQQFRQMVDIAANNLETTSDGHHLTTPRRVIGIYVGWRGESVNAIPFNYLTVFDRRNAAERVAQGAVRQLFANLRVQQLEEQGVFSEQCPNPAKMRTVVIGHSFGGLIAYTALAQAELNELTVTRATTPGHCDSASAPRPGGHLAPLWPDGLILINPAFEASRYESFYQLMQPGVAAAVAVAPGTSPQAPAKNKVLVVPHFIVVTSATDVWTGKFFTLGRAATTVFEGYDRTDAAATAAERDSNLHSIARVDAYLTHTLDLATDDPDANAVAHLVPRLADHAPYESPVWVVMASDRVVHGHDGFLYGTGTDMKNPRPYLANWLLQLFDMDCGAAPEMTCRLP